jgi:B12-binding domain/radical SAM domain protein
MAETVPHSTSQFVMFPIGLISMAEALRKNGYNTQIINLGEWMLADMHFDVERFIEATDSEVFAVDLHWCTHTRGAVQIACLCKKHHPNSLVVLGGLTSTRFHDEILRRCPFVDLVIRGEGELPIVEIAAAKQASGKLRKIPNLTHRSQDRRIISNPIAKPIENLDDFEFCSIELVKPNAMSTTIGVPPVKVWNVPICRGCLYNCVSCGGSAYSYLKMFGRERPAFRSPRRIVEDVKLLAEKGIGQVFLFQDARMGGKRYWNELFSLMKREMVDSVLTMELFSPADAEYLDALKNTGLRIDLNFSVESGAEHVRRVHGRDYSNEKVVTTMRLCRERDIKLGMFFMTVLGHDTQDSFTQTIRFCEEIYRMDRMARHRQDELQMPVPEWFIPVIGPMILLDPGSLAFDYPDRYGYRPLFRSFIDYYAGMGYPSWRRWISYETRNFTRNDIFDLILQALELNGQLREKYSVSRGRIENPEDRAFLSGRLFDLRAYRLVPDLVDSIMQSRGEKERSERLRELWLDLSEYSDRPWPRSHSTDRFGYHTFFEKIVHESVGLMTGS